MKIYELQFAGEKNWIAANTIIEAIQCWCYTSVTDLKDMDPEDIIIELPEEKWDKMMVKNLDPPTEEGVDDWATKTFRESIEGLTKPDVFAGTDFE